MHRYPLFCQVLIGESVENFDLHELNKPKKNCTNLKNFFGTHIYVIIDKKETSTQVR